MELNRQKEEKIVDSIIADLNTRSGMRWNAIDEETQQEIRNRWIDLVINDGETE